MRSETDPAYLGVLTGEDWRGAVSPDGRKVAWWEAFRTGAARVLWILDTAAPGQARKLLTLPDTEVAAISTFGGVVWSADSAGLLIAVNSRDYVQQPVPDAAHLYVTLRQLDVASGLVREILRKAPSHPYFPVAWDRAHGRSIAVGWGPGGFAMGYTLLRDGADPEGVMFPVLTLPSGVRASPSATHVLMRPFFDEARGIFVWPTNDPARRITLEPAADEHVVAALWRSDSEVVVSIAPLGQRETGTTLEVWSLDGKRRIVLTAPHRLDAVRPGGSAAITSAGVVDLDTGTLGQVPGLGSGLRVLASVILR